MSKIKKSIFNLGLIFPLLLTLLFPAKAMAASGFTHTHSASCYVTKTGTCYDQRIEIEHTTAYLHCPSCLVFKTFNRTIYWEYCNNGYQGRRDCGYVDQCSECGYYRQNNPGSAMPHSFTYKECVCGLSDGATEATVSLTAGTAGWTNGNVQLTAGVSKVAGNISFNNAGYSFSGGQASGNTCTVSENGTYSVTVTADDGRTADASVTVSNIDKVAPTVTLSKSTEEWSEGGVDITVSATDDASGLSEAAYSFNGGEYGSSTSIHMSQNGTMTVSVKDNAGNVGTASITVSNIGRDPKVVAAEKAAAEKAAAEKAAAEKAAAEKAAAEKAAATKAATGASTLGTSGSGASTVGIGSTSATSSNKVNITNSKTKTSSTASSASKTSTSATDKTASSVTASASKTTSPTSVEIYNLTKAAREAYFSSHSSATSASSTAASVSEETSNTESSEAPSLTEGHVEEGIAQVAGLGMSDSNMNSQYNQGDIVKYVLFIIGIILMLSCGLLLLRIHIKREKR